MKENNLIHLLKNLNNTEFRRLKKFLQSPFFNTNEQVTALYMLLKKYYPTFDAPSLTKQKVFKKLYPTLSYSDNKMRLLISDLKLVVEEYLVQLQLKKHTVERKKLWVNALAERNMTKFYLMEEQKLQDNLKAVNIHDAIQFKELYSLNHMLLFNKTNTNTQSNKNLVIKTNEYLDLFYFTRKLQYIASIASQNRVYKLKAQLPFTDLILKNIDTTTFAQFPIFKILKYLIELTQNGHSTNKYQAVKQLTRQHFDEFAPELKLNILQLLFNHCAYLYKSGKVEFLKEQFTWYKFGFDKKTLVEQVQLTDITYKNTIVLACHYQDLEWVKAFIEEYTDYLLPEERTVAKAIGLAYYYFNKSEYEAVIQQLQHIDFGPKHALNGRSLLLQSYIELYFLRLSTTDYIFHYAAAFKRYLKRSNNGAATILVFTNYINLSIKILEYHEFNKWGFEILMQELNEDKPLISKPWLMRILKK